MANKMLTVQLQPSSLAANTCELAIRTLENLGNDQSIAFNANVSYGKENGGYVNVEFESPDVALLWKVINEQLLSEDTGIKGLAKGVIVVCQGDFGWDDYLLLFHNDPSVRVDKMDPN